MILSDIGPVNPAIAIGALILAFGCAGLLGSYRD